MFVPVITNNTEENVIIYAKGCSNDDKVYMNAEFTDNLLLKMAVMFHCLV